MKLLVQQNPLLSYFVLAYGLSWILWIPTAWFINSTDSPPEWVLLLVALGIYGASGAGFITTGLVDGKPGVRKLFERLRNWRVGFQWYLFALLVVPVFLLAGFALYTLQGNPAGPFSPSKLPLLLLGAIPAILFGPLGEEFGWRGFALPRLLEKYGAFWSSIILGILHTFWHAPLFFVAGAIIGTIGENGLILVPIFLSFVTIGTFVYTFVLNNTRGSMLMAIIIHLMANSSGGIVFGMFPDVLESTQFEILAWAQIPGWILVVLLIIVFGPARLSRKSDSWVPSPAR